MGTFKRKRNSRSKKVSTYRVIVAKKKSVRNGGKNDLLKTVEKSVFIEKITALSQSNSLLGSVKASTEPSLLQ